MTNLSLSFYDVSSGDRTTFQPSPEAQKKRDSISSSFQRTASCFLDKPAPVESCNSIYFFGNGKGEWIYKPSSTREPANAMLLNDLCEIIGVPLQVPTSTLGYAKKVIDKKDIEEGELTLYNVYKIGERFFSINQRKDPLSEYLIGNFTPKDHASSPIIVEENELLIVKDSTSQIEYLLTDASWLRLSFPNKESPLPYRRVSYLSEDYWAPEPLLVSIDKIRRVTGSSLPLKANRNTTLSYDLLPKGSHYHIEGSHVPGIIQERVCNLWLGEGKPTKTQNQRDRIFQELNQAIPTKELIHTIIATILARPQDGKIVVGNSEKPLEESNYLFKPFSSPCQSLTPIMIDSGEWFPSRNDINEEPSMPKDNSLVCTVRCGLLAFSKVREKLDKDHSDYAERILRNILESVPTQELAISHYIEKYGLNKGVLTSYLQTIRRIRKFYNHNQGKEWSLEDLFFGAIPSYKKQWNLFAKDIQAEVRSSFIGNIPESLIMERYGNQPL